MPRLIWSPRALEDIRRLHNFLSSKDTDIAKNAVRAIRRSMNILAQQPEIGRPADGMDPEYREWLIDFGNNGYVALYRYENGTGIVLAIRHQKEAGY